MASSYSDRDLGLVPDITFSFVENFVGTKKKSSGKRVREKGFRYFSEGYIKDLRVKIIGDGSAVTGKCYRSQRKNESPHEFRVEFESIEGDVPIISQASCTCAIGRTKCGHIVGALYQLAKLKILVIKAFPEDIAKTSLPQTHHIPRGPKIHAQAVDELEVRGYSSSKPVDGAPRSIRSTLYNPIRGPPVDWQRSSTELWAADSKMLILPALSLQNIQTVGTKYGHFPKGSVLSYQQALEAECIINLYDGMPFPELPLCDVMENNLCTVLTLKQNTALDGLKLSNHDICKFERQTRMQNQSALWYKVREHRLTASKIGEIFKRRKDPQTLVDRLKTGRHVTTAAMRHGILCEPLAAQKYSDVKEKKINLYPCGVVVSQSAPWYAASPDRKVYNPNLEQPYGLLEIKCPTVTSVLEADYLKKDDQGNLKLKRNHNYYYQILTQLAVTGIPWCDLFVWCSNDFHFETIHFNLHSWQLVKDKVDQFFFDCFL